MNYCGHLLIWLYQSILQSILTQLYIYIGVTQAIQNAGLGGISYAVGAINDIDDTYVYIEIFYIAWLAVAILTTALMWILDFRKNNYLFMSDKQRKEFQQTPEYYKSMNMEIPSHLRNEGEENMGFEK